MLPNPPRREMGPREALAKSTKDFLEVVWPAVASSVGGGSIIPIEQLPDAFSKLLDRGCGVDFFQQVDSERIRGIASRVQWVKEDCWQSFTIREWRHGETRTELAKRTDAINANDGRILPHLTIQAYLTDARQLLSVGVVETRLLIPKCHEALSKKDDYSFRRCGGLRSVGSFERMVWVKWDWLNATGCPVAVTKLSQAGAA